MAHEVKQYQINVYVGGNSSKFFIPICLIRPIYFKQALPLEHTNMYSSLKTTNVAIGDSGS